MSNNVRKAFCVSCKMVLKMFLDQNYFHVKILLGEIRTNRLNKKLSFLSIDFYLSINHQTYYHIETIQFICRTNELPDF